MIFGERLTELRKENGYKTRKEFCEIIGIPETTLRNYEKGEREPGHLFIKQMSEFFHVSADYLLGLTDSKEILPDLGISKSESVIIEKYRKLDTHGHQVVSFLLDAEYERVQDIMAASRGESVGSSGTIAVPLLQDALSRKVIGTVPVAASDKIPGGGIDLFAWRIENNAMAPRIASGDTVIVHKQDDVNSGDIAVVLLDGVQVVCKQVIKEGDKLTLVPLNNKYQTRVFKQEDIKKRFKILGKVVENIQAV